MRTSKLLTVEEMHARYPTSRGVRLQELPAARAERRRKQQRERYWQGRKIIDEAKKAGCQVCELKEPLSALVFHHRDPAEKDGEIASWRSHGIQWLIAELAKCDVVCRECHRKLHRG